MPPLLPVCGRLSREYVRTRLSARRVGIIEKYSFSARKLMRAKTMIETVLLTRKETVKIATITHQLTVR